MRWIKVVGVTGLAVLALRAPMSASADANSLKNPSLLVVGVGGEGVEASAVNAQVLKAPNITIECTDFSLNPGSKLEAAV